MTPSSKYSSSQLPQNGIFKHLAEQFIIDLIKKYASNIQIVKNLCVVNKFWNHLIYNTEIIWEKILLQDFFLTTKLSPCLGNLCKNLQKIQI